MTQSAKLPHSLMPSGSVLVDTEEGKAWVASLPAKYHTAARAALKEITLVSEDAFEHGTRALIDSISSGSDRPIAVYCIRDVMKDENDVPEPYHDGLLMLRVRLDEPGSDWRIAHILFKSKSAKILDHPDIETLRKEQVHDIVFVDDVSMSGTNIGNLLTAFHSKKTLVSWYSHRWIRYHIVVHTLGHAARDGLIERLTANRRRQLLKQPPTIHCCREEPDTYSYDTLRFFKETKRLLGAKNRDNWGGFKRTLGRTVFAHGCPNNMPAIFWDTTGSISALFPNHSVPTALLPRFRGTSVLNSPIPTPFHLGGLDRVILREIASGAHTIRAIAGRTGLDLREAGQLQRRLRRLELIDEDGRLTEDGRKAAQTPEPKLSQTILASPDTFYYPRRRGVQ